MPPSQCEIQSKRSNRNFCGKEETLGYHLVSEVSVEISLGWTEFQKAHYVCECHEAKSSLSL